MVGGEPMSTLKVNRIEPRTGDSVEIVGFGTGGRIVNSGILYYIEDIVLTPNTTNHKVIEWTIDKVDPKNKVICSAVIGGTYTRTKSTAASSGVVVLKTYMSPDGGNTSYSGQQHTGVCPPSSIGNPRDQWIKGQMVHHFEDTTNSQQLNLSLTAIAHSDSSSDIVQINNDGVSTLSWIEIEGI
jgi:hypothetical protein